MKLWDSPDQRPPTSTPNTTKRGPGTHQLWVPSLFPTSRCLQSDSRCVCRTVSMPIGHDLQAPRSPTRGGEHCGHPASRLSTDSCDHTLKSKSPLPRIPSARMHGEEPEVLRLQPCQSAWGMLSKPDQLLHPPVTTPKLLQIAPFLGGRTRPPRFHSGCCFVLPTPMWVHGWSRPSGRAPAATSSILFAIPCGLLPVLQRGKMCPAPRSTVQGEP